MKNFMYIVLLLNVLLFSINSLQSQNWLNSWSLIDSLPGFDSRSDIRFLDLKNGIEIIEYLSNQKRDIGRTSDGGYNWEFL
ncbi:MAG: hypothetical protein QG635_2155, partial [Bacteroidota bacterium]|nr:hypothetical protein [Bacteroidota bacterium]